MKLEKLSIKNFRCFEEATIDFDDYTALIGPNGCGKSAVLSALNVFFSEKTSAIRSPKELDLDAFHHRNHASPIEIKLQFGSITPDEQTALATYVRSGKLIVSAEAAYDVHSETAEVKQYGYRLGIKKFSKFFELQKEGARVDALEECFNGLAQKFSLTISGRKTKAAMEGCLRGHEEANPSLCEEIKSEDQFYGFTKGSHKLRPFIRYLYLPAVKDAADEEQEARTGVLSELISRIVRSELDLEEQLAKIESEAVGKLKKLFDGQKGSLNNLSGRLTELAKNLFPELDSVQLKWNEELGSPVSVDSPLVSVDLKDVSTYSGPVSKFGHGIQRSYFLALLQLFAETAADSSTAKIIFACEEPELYQHPPQARHLAEAMVQISRKHGQVMATTHSPFFISGENFPSIRMLKMKNKKVSVSSALYNDVSRILSEAKQEQPHPQSAINAGLIQKLQPTLNEMFFSRFAVLVEGLEDIAYIRTQFDLRNKWSEFLALGGHIIPVGGKESMVSPAAICTALNHPFFCVLDLDGVNIGEEKHSKALAHFLKVDLSKVTKGEDFFDCPNAVFWRQNIQNSISADFPDDWNRGFSVACNSIGVSEGDAAKNSLIINLTLNIMASANKFSAKLDRVIDKLLAFGKQTR